MIATPILHPHAGAVGAFRILPGRETGVFYSTVPLPGGWEGGARFVTAALDTGLLSTDRAAADGGYAVLDVWDQPGGSIVQDFNITSFRAFRLFSLRLRWRREWIYEAEQAAYEAKQAHLVGQ